MTPDDDAQPPDRGKVIRLRTPSFADEAVAVANAAFERPSESWERSIQAAIADLFEFLTEREDQTSACFLRNWDSGAAELAERERVISRFIGLLQPGFAATDNPPPPVVAEAIGGGIYEIVHLHVLERLVRLLPDAAPDATFVALSPFMGARRAAKLAVDIRRRTRWPRGKPIE